MAESEARRDWLFERAIRRVAPVDGVVAEYATSICGRPARRREVRPDGADDGLGTVTWSIDDEVVVEFTAMAAGRVAWPSTTSGSCARSGGACATATCWSITSRDDLRHREPCADPDVGGLGIPDRAPRLT